MILATNDDGVASPGLVALRQCLEELGRVVVVVAPGANRSGWGGLGAARLGVEEVGLADGSAALAVDGGPADCVRLAASGALGQIPRLVVSGINLGENVGPSLSVSGTLAAALQAAMLGLPAMAVSQERPRDGGRWDFRAAQAATVRLAAALLELPQEGVALNMNVPGLPPEDVRGLRLTAVATEAGALARGEVSVTPMRVVPAHLPLPAAAPLEAAGSITS